MSVKNRTLEGNLIWSQISRYGTYGIFRKLGGRRCPAALMQTRAAVKAVEDLR